MKRFKRVITGLIAVLFVLAPFSVAAQDESRIFDDAGLFSPTNIQRLDEKIADMEAGGRWNYYIVTTRDAGGKTARSFADDFYDQNHLGRGEDASGVLLLIDMDNREAYISTGGAAVDYYTSGKIEDTLDKISSSLSRSNYYSAANSFLNAVDAPMQSTSATPAAGNSNSVTTQPETDTQTTEETTAELTLGQWVAVSASWAVIAVGIFIAVVWSKHRANGTVRGIAVTPQNQDQLTLTRSEDRFVNVVTHTRRIQQSSSQSRNKGGTKPSVHRSSSGVRHGGGGRKF